MQTWIFQGNPDQFDLDAYLATSPTQLPWLVTRYAERIAVDDRVFIWRTQGSAKKHDAGIVAEATRALMPFSSGATTLNRRWKRDLARSFGSTGSLVREKFFGANGSLKTLF